MDLYNAPCVQAANMDICSLVINMNKMQQAIQMTKEQMPDIMKEQ